MGTVDEYNLNDSRLRQQFPTLVHIPSLVHLVYRQSPLLLVCLICLGLAGMEDLPGTAFFLWLALVTTLYILYQFLFLKSSKYSICHDRIRFQYGVLGQSGEKVELYRVRDIKWRKPLLLRPFSYGYVEVVSTDYSTPRLIIPGVKDPERLAAIIGERVEVNRISKRAYEITNM